MQKPLFSLLALIFASVLWSEAPVYDARLTRYAYPYPVESFAFQSQNQSLEMAYMHLKARNAQPTFLLLHGKNFSGYYFKPVIEALHKMGFGVLIPDQIGFGKSSKPAYYQFGFPQLARNTHKLMESLNISEVIVIGHSMGGMLATRFALMYPESTRHLFLINPIGLENYLDHTHYQDVEFFYQSELAKTAEGIRAYQKKNYYDGQWSEAYENLIQTHIGWLNGPDHERIAWNNALTYDMIFSQPVVEDFRKIRVPASLILGTRDRTGPGRGFQKDADSYELGRYDLLGKISQLRMPGSRLYEIPGLGHMPFIEDFNRFQIVFQTALEDAGLSPNRH